MFHLVATFAAAIGVAGILYAGFRVLGRRPPKFLIPLAAGITMLAYNIWSEYAWHWRTVDALPPQVMVVDALPYRAAWQPWTYVFPRINRLIALDRSRLRRNHRAPGYVLADILLIERLEPTKSITQMFDCANGRVTDFNPEAKFDARGLPKGATWSRVREDSPLLAAVCRSPEVSVSPARRGHYFQSELAAAGRARRTVNGMDTLQTGGTPVFNAAVFKRRSRN